MIPHFTNDYKVVTRIFHFVNTLQVDLTANFMHHAQRKSLKIRYNVNTYLMLNKYTN